MGDYTEHLISMAGGDGEPAAKGNAALHDEGELLARCIRSRRRRKCIAAGDHHPEQPPDGSPPAKCPRCGL